MMDDAAADDVVIVRSDVFSRYIACRGYHHYNGTIWDAIEQYPGRKVVISPETLPASLQVDPYCCAVQILIPNRVANTTIGHIPREISRFTYYFLKHGGKIDGHVSSMLRRKSPIPSGGLEVKLKLFFRGSSMSLVDQMRQFISRYDYEWEQPADDNEDSDNAIDA